MNMSCYTGVHDLTCKVSLGNILVSTIWNDGWTERQTPNILHQCLPQHTNLWPITTYKHTLSNTTSPPSSIVQAYLVMKLLLESGPEIGGHLPESITSCISDSGMLKQTFTLLLLSIPYICKYWNMNVTDTKCFNYQLN